MKSELLSPAGNYDSLVMAVLNGADAVYLAGKDFGARKFAGNFTNDELEEAIYFAHLYGVKVYVTVNIIVYENERSDFISFITHLYKMGVDALIMQDIGMISLVRRMFPNIDIHASTQVHNHNDFGLELLKELGVKRVVFDREMSLDEIKKVSVSLEKEVFIHGALCVSYSGCCLFSSMNGGRSGNRGECVQSCRLPYRLMKNDEYIALDDKYLLSTKELNTMGCFQELLEANITSFKIEGRMKSPSYVGYVTRLYRKLIDNYYEGRRVKISEEEYDNLKILFNREFTLGYLFNDDIMNIGSSNHQGLVIGEVISCGKRIKIKLSKNLYQMDGIRFKNSNLGMNANMIYNDMGLLVNSAKKGEVIYLDNKINLKNRDIVLKTSSKFLEDEIERGNCKKIKIAVFVTAKKNEKLLISFSDGKSVVSILGSNVLKAINRPTTKGEVLEKLSKLGKTPFEAYKFDIRIDDDVFINMKELNNLRRSLVDALIYERTRVKREIIINNDDSNSNYNFERNDFEIAVLVRTKEQMDTCLRNNVNRIYADYDLYKEYKEYDNVYLRLPRVMGDSSFNAKNVLVTELGSIKKYSSSNIVSDYYLNVVNNSSIDYFKKHNVQRITVSPEIGDDRLRLLNTDRLELIIYGRIELMVLKYCPLKKLIKYCPNCKDGNDNFYLVDNFSNKYPIIHDNCLTHIMHYKNILKLNEISKYIDMGIKSYRLELFDESGTFLEELIKKIRNRF